MIMALLLTPLILERFSPLFSILLKHCKEVPLFFHHFITIVYSI